mmetsp:Transcript_49489/g.111287  ORF Transcript_49489/g.111287 Transcript_49489/m.111287 type:complete len:84 (-) Transcript_49489:288-539(-)
MPTLICVASVFCPCLHVHLLSALSSNSDKGGALEPTAVATGEQTTPRAISQSFLEAEKHHAGHREQRAAAPSHTCQPLNLTKP